ncbi:MAG: hypothetical protein IJ634_05695 [Bacteroidales bacterium]|nr:hypothetical protein [Bacteroidales bacterium]
MKHNRFTLAMALLLPFATLAQAQPAQPAPSASVADKELVPLSAAVRTLVFDDCNAVIVPDSQTGYEDGKMNNGSGIQVSGSEMTFSGQSQPVRIHLMPGTVTRIVANGLSEVTLQGSFRIPGTMELVGNDASTITLRNSFDTFCADRMVVSLQDVARLNAHSRLQIGSYDFNIKDYSRLKAFIVEMTGTSNGEQSRFCNTNYASFHIGHKLYGGERAILDPEEQEEFWATDDDSFDIDDLSDLDGDAMADLVRKIKLSRSKRYSWGTNIDFAWGFHNWGSDRFNGLAGTDGDAAVRTSFNHILLTVNYPVVYSKHVALFAGLGMEWDKYKFHRGDIHFDLSAEPYHLVNGTVTNSESRLLTRYVILPIEVKFALGRHWKLGLAAIPGLHWSGSHTGLRRDITSGNDEVNIRDYSINPYINPYKLDARISVQYRSIGVYFQASMLPAFKSSCDDLFPVKFGIIL